MTIVLIIAAGLAAELLLGILVGKALAAGSRDPWGPA